MIRWKVPVAGGAILAVVALTGFYLSPANGAVGGAGPLKNPATGVGSCTLKNSEPKLNLPKRRRHRASTS